MGHQIAHFCKKFVAILTIWTKFKSKAIFQETRYFWAIGRTAWGACTQNYNNALSLRISCLSQKFNSKCNCLIMKDHYFLAEFYRLVIWLSEYDGWLTKWDLIANSGKRYSSVKFFNYLRCPVSSGLSRAEFEGRVWTVILNWWFCVHDN